MARIAIRTAGAAQSWEIGEVPLTLGRRPDNDIVVADGYASGRHAVIGRDAGGCYLEDLKSSNGTRVNGRRVERAALQHGDVIRIGVVELVFEDAAAALDRTMVIASAPEPPSAPAPAADAAPRSPPPQTASMLDELVGSIRSHRDREQQERAAAEQRLQAEWERLLVLADELKAKTAVDARVRRFVIDRRSRDITIQVQRSPASPMVFINVSPRHPEQKSQLVSGLWLQRTGEPDRCLQSAQAVAAELVRDLAFLLA